MPSELKAGITHRSLFGDAEQTVETTIALIYVLNPVSAASIGHKVVVAIAKQTIGRRDGTIKRMSEKQMRAFEAVADEILALPAKDPLRRIRTWDRNDKAAARVAARSPRFATLIAAYQSARGENHVG